MFNFECFAEFFKLYRNEEVTLKKHGVACHDQVKHSRAIFLAVTAISREYRFALYCITCEDVSCIQHGPPDYNLFLQKKNQLMANGPLF